MLRYKRRPSQRRRRESRALVRPVWSRASVMIKPERRLQLCQLDASIMQAAGIDRDEVPGLRPMGSMHRHSSQGRDLSSTGLVGRAPFSHASCRASSHPSH